MAANKHYISLFRWSKMVWVTSILTTILIVGASIATLYIPDMGNSWEAYLVAIIMLPLPIVCFALSPRRLYLYGDMLIIKRWVGSVTISTHDIISVSEADRWLVLRSKRTMGNGGYFGYYGHFYNRQYGKFRMFATDTAHLYLIRTSRQNFVIECTNKELIAELQDRKKS